MASVLEPAPPERPSGTNGSDERSLTTLGLAALGAAVALGALGDALLRAVPWGINVPIWIVALVVAVLIASRRGTFPPGGNRRWALLAAAIFAACLAWRDSLALNFANVLAVLIALALAALRTRAGQLHLAGVTDYGLGLIDAFVHALVGPLLLVFQDIRWQDVPRGGWSHHAAAVGRGLAVAIPLLFAFGLLFVAADAAFEGIVRRVFGFDLTDLIGHLLLSVAIAWIVAGFLRQMLVSQDWESPLPGRPSGLAFGMVETTIVLGLLNVLFLLFVIVQFRYFFGGASLVETSTTMTYSEYARRGFFELVAVAALLLPILLLVEWAARRERPSEERLFRFLAGALVVMLFVIMFSAVQRMRLYVDEFGLTELRVYPTAFMAWLAIVFVWFLVTVLRGRRHRFAIGGLVAGFAVLLAMNVLNPEGLIVRVNASRDLAPRPFDAAYVTSLSADAIPSLIEALPSLHDDARRRVATRLIGRWAKPEVADWRSWNWGRSRAWERVEDNREMLRQEAGSEPRSS